LYSIIENTRHESFLQEKERISTDSMNANTDTRIENPQRAKEREIISKMILHPSGTTVVP